MKRFIINLLLLSLFSITFHSCKDTGTNKVSATGSIYECLVVSNEAVYNLVKPVMEADMPCMPQMEPYFKVMHVVPSQFDSYLMPTRNILIVDIDSTKYTTFKAKITYDAWSHPQAVYRIQSPRMSMFEEFWSRQGETVRDWFVTEEIHRQTLFYRASTNKEARQALRASSHVDLLIPEDYRLIMDTTLHSPLSLSTHLTWCCNNKGPMRRDLVVYSYPYTDKRTFSLDYLCQRRDEVLGQVVTASVPGSYMGTEYRIFPPQYRVLNDSVYTAEVRGLWKIYGGEAMGGPYVSHTVLDEQRGQVVTAEVFLYAAGQKKRNALRQAEAILYTLEIMK